MGGGERRFGVEEVGVFRVLWGGVGEVGEGGGGGEDNLARF